MTQTAARNMFVVGTIIFGLIFLYMTYDSLRQMPKRTHEEALTDEVVEGKALWQKHNCNDCHTILGIGGYYAPDITKVSTYRNDDWLKRFLKDPQGTWPAKRVMPNLHLSDRDVSALVAFMKWVSNIDTNGWPPKPMNAAAATTPGEGPADKAAEGRALVGRLGCQGCHKINGAGGDAGPDLTHVGSRLPDIAWHISHLKDPGKLRPGSAMPPFSNLPESELDEVAEYLVTLK